MNPSLTLRGATVQDIQLELIRRTRFNDFHGERVCELLNQHRGHWQAVLLDHPGVPNYKTPGRLLTSGLIKLRDLGDNIWNADTLYILTHTPAQARELAALFEEMGGMPRVYEDEEEMGRALGMSRAEYGLLTVWWD
jgi:hypothetical protein